MGNIPKYNKNSSNSISNQNKQIIINNRLKKNRNNKIKSYNNKKSNLDLFRNINDSNDGKDILKLENENKPDIIIKNNFINDKNNIGFLKKMNNNNNTNNNTNNTNNNNTIINNTNNDKKITNVKNKKEKSESPFKGNKLNDDSNKKEKINLDTIKINQNLYEFEINNNNKCFQYRPENIQEDSNNKKDEILSSERTINITNSEGEFFFDNNNNNNNNEQTNNINKSNIFNNIKKYELKKNNNNNIKNKEITNDIQKLKNNNIKNYKEKVKMNKIKVKIDDINYNNIKYNKFKLKNKHDINNNKKNDNIVKIYNTNNNNLLLISSFLTNKKNSKNKKNKSHSTNRINKTLQNKSNNNIHKNFSFKNLSNNIIVNPKMPYINSYKENNNLKLTKNKNNNINLIQKKMHSKYFSDNYKNLDICNEHSYNLNEKQKLAELIEKIPNNKLKKEIMILYQKIINYNNEIIINNKNSNYNYIITFSNNYIEIDKNEFPRKKFNNNNFIIKKPIKISLISTKKNNNKYRYISRTTKNKLQKNKSISLNSNNKISHYNKNLMLNNIDDESIFKQYTFHQYKKSENKTNEKIKFEHSSSSNLDTKIKNIKTINYSNLLKEKKENNNLKIIEVNNKVWKKIINLNEVTINNDKIFPLTMIEKSNSHLLNTDIITNDKYKRNSSINFKPKKETINYLNKGKTSKSIDVFKNKENLYDINKNEKYNSFNLGKEQILFYINMKRLIKVNNLLKTIKIYKKNHIFKEEDLIMYNVICFLSTDYIIIFKDKEKMKSLFKKNLNLIKKIMSFKKKHKFILIIEFNNSTNNKIKINEMEEKDKYLGLLIDKEKNYNEFIAILTKLVQNLEISFLN